LEKLARGRSTPVRIVQRSRIVLLAGDVFKQADAERMEVAPRMAHCGATASDTGRRGLLRDASRPGRLLHHTQTVTQIIEKTTQSKPANATHGRQHHGAGSGRFRSSVGRIWRSHGLKRIE